MATRKLRFQKGQYYHMYNRAMLKLSMFVTEGDYIRFIRRMLALAELLDIKIVAWSLMPNHFHLLVRQDGDESAGKMVSRLFNSYSMKFNRIYSRSGRLCESAFKAIHVQTASYLTGLCHYIHANPVFHGSADAPEDWTYSNYREFLCGEADADLPENLRNPAAYKTSFAEYLARNKNKIRSGRRQFEMSKQGELFLPPYVALCIGDTAAQPKGSKQKTAEPAAAQSSKAEQTQPAATQVEPSSQPAPVNKAGDTAKPKKSSLAKNTKSIKNAKNTNKKQRWRKKAQLDPEKTKNTEKTEKAWWELPPKTDPSPGICAAIGGKITPELLEQLRQRKHDFEDYLMKELLPEQHDDAPDRL